MERKTEEIKHDVKKSKEEKNDDNNEGVCLRLIFIF
jgi:hypothetical protein